MDILIIVAKKKKENKLKGTECQLKIVRDNLYTHCITTNPSI